MTATQLVALDADHPGFHDRIYRGRRNAIARAALEYREHDAVPTIEYTEEEQGVWREVWRNLSPLHDRYACSEYRDVGKRVRIDRQRVPQLAEINSVIEPMHGFRMLPVAGLVQAGDFLSRLANDVFLSTQYMRHHSVPLYTPEPDIVHELIGHAATFGDANFVALNRAFGAATMRAKDADTVEKIGRLYWYTLEFGVVREGSEIKVYGAGLLSSFGELGRFEKEESLLPWNVEQIVDTPYDPTRYQPTLFIAPSFDVMMRDVIGWLERASAP